MYKRQVFGHAFAAWDGDENNPSVFGDTFVEEGDYIVLYKIFNGAVDTMKFAYEYDNMMMRGAVRRIKRNNTKK